MKGMASQWTPLGNAYVGVTASTDFPTVHAPVARQQRLARGCWKSSWRKSERYGPRIATLTRSVKLGTQAGETLVSTEGFRSYPQRESLPKRKQLPLQKAFTEHFSAAWHWSASRFIFLRFRTQFNLLGPIQREFLTLVRIPEEVSQRNIPTHLWLSG